MDVANDYGGSVDYQLSIGSEIDMFHIDECAEWDQAYYSDLASYVHSKGKMFAVNPGGWQIWSETCVYSDMVSVEFAWREFIEHKQDLIAQYPNKFIGVSNDWGYQYYEPIGTSVNLTVAVDDTLEAWDGGVYYFESRPQNYYLPDWWEDYINAVSDNPSHSDVDHDTTVAGSSCLFSSLWRDTVGLSGFYFSWNGTGSWTNNTLASLSGTLDWANATKTLPSAGTVVGYRWYCKDTDNNWVATNIYSLTTTSVGENTVALGTPSDGGTGYENTETFTYTPAFTQVIENSSVWLNISGTWQIASSNASAVQNNTLNSISYTFSTSATYVWNVGVYNSSDVVFASQNRTVIVVLEPSNIFFTHNSTIASASCNLSSSWLDGDGLSGYIVGHNNTGTAVNGS